MVESEEPAEELFGYNFRDNGKVDDCLFSDFETSILP